MARIRPIFWRIVAVLILSAGAYATFVRFTKGLGASTNMTDTWPWGIWIGFDVLCGVGLAAGGFAITSAVYILHIESLRPVVRPAILTAFLGYLLVMVGLMFDLGKPWNIWHPIILWNPRSVMFEVGWCVMLYSTVLALEFSSVLWDKLKWERAKRISKSMTPVLVGLGFLLSTLHQSSLGTLYLILPTKLHPLWYSPLLPVLFWLSALAIGLAMVIFESGLSARAFNRHLEFHLLQRLSKAMALCLSLYVFLRFWDLGWRGSLGAAFVVSGPGSMEASMFWLEMMLMGLPAALVLMPHVRGNPQALFASAVMAVGGFVVNRLNVSITGLEAAAGVRYLPSWMEVAVTMSIVTVGMIVFAIAVKHLPIFPEEKVPARTYA
jgi:Ni/Fe-hydrogenase subunit HybB-like protein